jgi:hypothetical protein
MRQNGSFGRAKLARAGVLAVVVVFALSACNALLQRSHSEASGTWKSFDEARAAMESIRPG